MKYLKPLLSALTLVISLALLNGCSQTPSKPLPDWVSSPPTSTHTMEYAVGSADGSGNDAQLVALAQQHARLALAQQLQTTVSGSTRIQTQQTQIGTTETAFEQSLKQDVKAQVAPLELTGVRIEKTYVEPRPDKAPLTFTRSAYALASVNKADNIQRFQTQLITLDESIENYLTLAPQDTKIDTLIKLAPALPILEKRAAIKRQLLALNPNFPTQVGDNHAQKLSEKLHQLLSQLSVDVVANADQPSTFRTKLQSQLQALGFALGGMDADLHILTDLTATQDLRNGLYYQFYEGIVQLTDRKHRPIMSFSSESKGASQYPQKAEQQALSHLAAQIARQLKTLLIKGRQP